MTNISNKNRKRVLPQMELSANYLLHLMAVAGNIFESDYADYYRDSVYPDDLRFLEKNKKYMTAFRSGSGGESIADMVIGFPIAFALESRDDFENYFNIVAGCYRDHSMTVFAEAYADKIKIFQKMIPFEINDLIEYSVYSELIAAVGKIIISNISKYCKDVWPIELEKMSGQLHRLSSYYENSNLIHRWESITGLDFKTDYFIPSLCSAIKGGPDANSIGYDRVLFYYARPFDELAQFISHEIGTHILIDIYFNHLKAGQYDPASLFMAYECLAMFYNRQVLKIDQTAYRLNEFPELEYQNIYGGLYDKNSEITPTELLQQGLEIYLSGNR